MKRLLLVCALPALLASCVSSPSPAYNHWSARSISPQMAWHFLGYQPDKDGSYADRLWMDRKNIDLTLQRHFLNWNPMSPFQPEDSSHYHPRPTHSPLPNAIPYAVMLPGSIFASFEKGGGTEFWSGVSETLRPVRVMSATFVNETVGPNGPVVGIFTGGDYEPPEQRGSVQH